jgi:hypothetical protein
MLRDCLIGLAWVAIVLVPAIVAYLQPVVSHNGYLENYMDPGTQATSGKASDSDNEQ